MQIIYTYLGWYLTFIMSHLCSIMLLLPFTRIPFLFATNSNATPKRLKDYMKWGIRRAAVINPSLSKILRTGKALIIYYSETGNTEKVAIAINQGLRRAGLEPTIKKVSEALDENYFNYDLVCLGSPVYHALPPPALMKLIHKNFDRFRKSPRDVQLPSSSIPGKYALIFVTFSGPHVGVNEALPTGKLLVQELQHLGFKVKGEWYIVGEFHEWKDGSTRGRLGDIRGRPNQHDLEIIEEKAFKLANSIENTSKSKVVWINY